MVAETVSSPGERLQALPAVPDVSCRSSSCIRSMVRAGASAVPGTVSPEGARDNAPWHVTTNAPWHVTTIAKQVYAALGRVCERRLCAPCTTCCTNCCISQWLLLSVKIPSRHLLLRFNVISYGYSGIFLNFRLSDTRESLQKFERDAVAVQKPFLARQRCPSSSPAWVKLIQVSKSFKNN